MANATEINPCISGNVGKRTVVSEETLSSGTASVTTGLQRIEYALITEKAASASGEKFSWAELPNGLPGDDKLLLVDSSNGSSTAVVSVLIIGH